MCAHQLLPHDGHRQNKQTIRHQLVSNHQHNTHRLGCTLGKDGKCIPILGGLCEQSRKPVGDMSAEHEIICVDAELQRLKATSARSTACGRQRSA